MHWLGVLLAHYDDGITRDVLWQSVPSPIKDIMMIPMFARFYNYANAFGKKVVVSCRVSSRKPQKDLESQLDAMRSFCLNRGVAVVKWVTEIAGGMNFFSPKFLSQNHFQLQGKISHIYIAHKDRLARFGFDLIDYLKNKIIVKLLLQTKNLKNKW